jgi:nicotinamide mononucleotide adenylyltransferase
MAKELFSREVTKRLKSLTGVVSDFPRQKLRKASETKPNIVLLAAGSFSPITFLHLRLFEQARDALQDAGYEVLGGYISPVHDSYKKKGLAPAEHRVKMCNAAVETSDWIMVDSWECKQSEYLTTILVLNHIFNNVNDGLTPKQKPVEVRLICGGDLVESFTTPGVWAVEDMREILENFGLVSLERAGTNLEEVIKNFQLLSEFKNKVFILKQTIPNEISSTRVREEIMKGHSIRYLTPDPVVEYIKANGLYKVLYNS